MKKEFILKEGNEILKFINIPKEFFEELLDMKIVVSDKVSKDEHIV